MSYQKNKENIMNNKRSNIRIKKIELKKNN